MLLQHGMSIGIGDTVADVATGAKIGAIIDAAKEDVQRIIEQYQVCVRHEAFQISVGSSDVKGEHIHVEMG